MNKSDLKLIALLFLFIIIIFIFFKLFEKKGNKALVYYEDKIVLEIDLTKNSDYEVKGYNGQVKIRVKNNKIKVIEENSPIHLCSRQGYISKSYETIVCLPNKVIIKIESDDDFDTVIR